jgi:hypothetical protein
MDEFEAQAGMYALTITLIPSPFLLQSPRIFSVSMSLSRLSLILSSFDMTVCTVVSAGLHSTGLRPELDWTLDMAVCTAVSSFRHPAPPSEFNHCLARLVCTRSRSNSVAVLTSISPHFFFCSVSMSLAHI